MVPGFTGFLISESRQVSHDEGGSPIRLAGLWDTPPNRCRHARTDTFCTGLVLWCKEVDICVDSRDNPLFGHEESHVPYPCGVCVGVTSPDDW